MTSQVAIHNAIGVAVASDTALTETTWAGAKTMPNVEKIFVLPEPHQLVVLHSGNLRINDTHGRLCLFDWIRQLPGRLPTVSDYADHFTQFMDSDRLLLPDGDQQRLVAELVNDFYRTIREEVFQLSREGGSPDRDGLFELRAKRNIEKAKLAPKFSGCSSKRDFDFVAKLDIDLQERQHHYFHHFPGWETFSHELTLAIGYVLSRYRPSSVDSTLGFVGFGESDHVSQDVKMDVRGKYNGSLRYSSRPSFGATVTGMSGALHTFAQDDAIWSFLRGVSPHLSSYSGNLLSHLLEDEQIGLSSTAVAQLVDKFDRGLEEYQHQEFVMPALRTVGGLGLRGLAELAESLVSMQAMRSASSSGPASVGGKIEVLTIDRINGVQWVKRIGPVGQI